MKKLLFAAAASTAMLGSLLFALDEKELSKKMKSVGEHNGELRKAMQAKAMPAIAQHAAGIADAWVGVEAFWKDQGMEKAVQWQRDGDAAAKELAAAAKSENADAVRSAMGKLGGSCKQCHEAHREKVSEGVYRIKK